MSEPASRDRLPREASLRAECVLRAARPRDLPAVSAIEQASFGDPWSPASFGALVDNPQVWFAVAECAGVVTGYLVAWFAADEAEVGNVAVAAAARGRGLGGMLVDAGLAEAAARGAATVFLEVRESNEIARRLYAGRGFREVGRRRRYYRNPAEDALVLARALGAGPAGSPARAT